MLEMSDGEGDAELLERGVRIHGSNTGIRSIRLCILFKGLPTRRPAGQGDVRG